MLVGDVVPAASPVPATGVNSACGVTLPVAVISGACSAAVVSWTWVDVVDDPDAASTDRVVGGDEVDVMSAIDAIVPASGPVANTPAALVDEPASVVEVVIEPAVELVVELVMELVSNTRVVSLAAECECCVDIST